MMRSSRGSCMPSSYSFCHPPFNLKKKKKKKPLPCAHAALAGIAGLAEVTAVRESWKALCKFFLGFLQQRSKKRRETKSCISGTCIHTRAIINKNFADIQAQVLTGFNWRKKWRKIIFVLSFGRSMPKYFFFFPGVIILPDVSMNYSWCIDIIVFFKEENDTHAHWLFGKEINDPPSASPSSTARLGYHRECESEGQQWLCALIQFSPG